MEKTIKLSPPKIEGEFMQALKSRHSSREFTSKSIDHEELSNLLWAAYGNNRQNKERKPHTFLAYKTVPSFCATYMYLNGFFVFTDKAIYKYDTDQNVLNLVKEGDYREKTGMQDFVKNASVNIVLFSDYDIMKKYPSQHIAEFFQNDEICMKASCFDAGYISQNIYIYATLHGMKSIARFGAGDENELRSLLGLGNNFHLILAHSVGY